MPIPIDIVYTGQVIVDPTFLKWPVTLDIWIKSPIFSLQFYCFVRFDNFLEPLFCSFCTRQKVHEINDCSKHVNKKARNVVSKKRRETVTTSVMLILIRMDLHCFRSKSSLHDNSRVR
jgi:hypothetical protein